MLDYRVFTFLSLCETLNYTKTAAQLQMTQPGVTQHVQFLEKSYGCRLFRRNGRSIELTEAGKLLEQHLRQVISAELQQRLTITAPRALPLRIGATKTIGEYVIPSAICQLASNPRFDLTLEVENTDILLHRLDHFEIDLALIEGFFDKERYAHRLLRREDFLGLCGRSHPFAGQSVPLEDLFSQHILLREPGSGTRSIFEDALRRHGYTVHAFRRQSCISSFTMMKQLLRTGPAISFAYRSVAENEAELATFTLQEQPLFGEFNYVYLPTYQGTPWFLDAMMQAMPDPQQS